MDSSLIARFAISFLIASSAALLPLQAQQLNYNTQLMEKLYTKLAQSPTVGTNTAAAGRSILILANPGIPLDPGLHPETSQDDRRAISRVLDHVPAPSWIYREMPYSLSQVYSVVLQYHELPVSSMTVQQKQTLKSANGVLFKNGDPARGDSDKVKAYKRYRATFQDQENAAESHRAADGTVPQQYAQAQEKALQDWTKVGYKNDVESALADRNGLISVDPSLWFQDLTAAYSAAQESPGTPNEFEPIGLIPSYSTWSKLNGWTTVTLTGDEIQGLQPTAELLDFQPLNHATIGRVSSVTAFSLVGGGIGGSASLDQLPAPASPVPAPPTNLTVTPTPAPAPAAAPIAGVTMEVLRVSLDRPWLDDLVFRSRVWKWSSAAPLASTLISDGATPPGSIQSDILMPYVPTAILISRNANITAPLPERDVAELKLHASGGTSVSIGPFSIGARFEDNVNKQTAAISVTPGGISIPGYQIIGWYCEVLPKSPNPDMANFIWPSVPP